MDIKIGKIKLGKFRRLVERYNKGLQIFMEDDTIAGYLCHSIYRGIINEINAFLANKEYKYNEYNLYELWLHLRHLHSFISRLKDVDIGVWNKDKMSDALEPLVYAMVEGYDKLIEPIDIEDIEYNRRGTKYQINEDKTEDLFSIIQDFNYYYNSIKNDYSVVRFGDGGTFNIDKDRKWGKEIFRVGISKGRISIKEVKDILALLVDTYDDVYNVLYKKYLHMLGLGDGRYEDRELLEAMYRRIYRDSYLLLEFNNNAERLYSCSVGIWAKLLFT